MKTTFHTLSLSSLLVALTATVAATAGAPLPTALSPEALLDAFTAVGAVSLMLADYSRNRRVLSPVNAPTSGITTLLPAHEAFARRLAHLSPEPAAGGGRGA